VSCGTALSLCNVQAADCILHSLTAFLPSTSSLALEHIWMESIRIYLFSYLLRHSSTYIDRVVIELKTKKVQKARRGTGRKFCRILDPDTQPLVTSLVCCCIRVFNMWRVALLLCGTLRCLMKCRPEWSVSSYVFHLSIRTYIAIRRVRWLIKPSQRISKWIITGHSRASVQGVLYAHCSVRHQRRSEDKFRFAFATLCTVGSRKNRDKFPGFGHILH